MLQREPHSAVTVNELNIFAVVSMQVADYLVIAETNKFFTARCCNMSVLCDSCASYLRGQRKNQLCPIHSLRGTRRSGSLGAHLHVLMKTHLWQFAEQAADVSLSIYVPMSEDYARGDIESDARLLMIALLMTTTYEM